MIETPLPNLPRDPQLLALATAYPGWRQHGVTNALVKVLEKRRDTLIANIQQTSASSSSDPTTLRIFGVQLRETNNTLKVINEIQQFVQEYSA